MNQHNLRAPREWMQPSVPMCEFHMESILGYLNPKGPESYFLHHPSYTILLLHPSCNTTNDTNSVYILGISRRIIHILAPASNTCLHWQSCFFFSVRELLLMPFELRSTWLATSWNEDSILLNTHSTRYGDVVIYKSSYSLRSERWSQPTCHQAEIGLTMQSFAGWEASIPNHV